jgi:hypothetical protein
MAHESADPDEGGHIVRGPDGALYFLRDSVLQQAKLPEDLAAEALKILDEEPEEDTDEIARPAALELEPVATVKSGPDFTPANVAFSTVMCPTAHISRLDRVSLPEGQG